MTNEEFKKTLIQFKYYLKPALFTVLSENAGAFSVETKQEIVDKIMEADTQTKKLYDYQEKRVSIMKQGLEKIEQVYDKVKARFAAEGASDKAEGAKEADKLISNL